MNVSHPAYGQLQKLRQVKDENSLVAAFSGEDDPPSSAQPRQFMAAWEPKGQRMLRMVLTNGRQSVEALEDRPVPQLPDAVSARPGLKLTLFGPLTVRRGLVLLGPGSVRVHGGGVEELERSWPAGNTLAARLGKMAPDPSLMEVHGVAEHPTQTFVPKGIPTKYRTSAPPSNHPSFSSSSRRRPFAAANAPAAVPAAAAASASRVPRVSLASPGMSSVFDDSEDNLFASISLPGECGGGDGGRGAAGDRQQDLENVFDDDADDLLSSIDMPSPGRGRGGGNNVKRRRF